MAGKVFISHASEDAARCMPLLRAFGAWGVDYWFDTQEHVAGQQLSQQAESGRTRVMLLVRCTRY